jgi:cellulose synthase operon protein C
MYKAFAVENKGSELAPRAWWNASQILFKTGDAAGGAGLCSEMNKMFPGSANVKECLGQAARTFEAIARLDLAAKVVLTLADIEPEKRNQWRDIASDFFALSGTRDGRERALQMFLKTADEKKPDAKLKVLEKAMQVAKELKDQKSMTVIRAKIESLGLEPAASRFLVEEAEAAYAAGDFNKAFNLSKRVVGRESQLSSDKEIAARARFLQARILDDEYRGQSVKARVDRIGLVLALKTEKLEKAQKAYQSASRMGDNSVAIESFAKLADLYIDYSHTVKAMKLPADVPDADQQAFAKEIETIAMPMEEKGIEALSQAIDAARKSARLDGLAGRLQEKLDRLNLKSETTPKIEVEALPKLVPGFSSKVFGMLGGGDL